jgi:hypothetical protein
VIGRETGIDASQWSAEEDRGLIRLLMDLFFERRLRIHSCPFDYCEVTAHPVVSHLARLQADRGMPIVTATLEIFPAQSPLMRHLIALLDGSRDFEGLLLDLSSRGDPWQAAGITAANVRRSLDSLSCAGLLVA